MYDETIGWLIGWDRKRCRTWRYCWMILCMHSKSNWTFVVSQIY